MKISNTIIKSLLAKLPNQEVVFYGAGENMKAILRAYRECGLNFDYTIWDINAQNILTVQGERVSKPDLETVVRGKTAVITIGEPFINFTVSRRLALLGYNVINAPKELSETAGGGYPCEFSEEERDLIDMVYDSKLTLVSRESLFATLTACKHAAQANIEGDFVECGVWRGGNAILAALTFQLQKCDKKVYCFDTFQGFRGLEAGDKDGFAQQTETDKELYASYWSELDETAFNPETAGVSLEDVRESFALCGVNPEKVVFVKGNVMKTLDGSDVPRHISVLRLDTDWYESTRKELEVLYPRVSVGGVLIVDDYGAHQGSRTATDEYFNKVARPMLQYTDWHARLGVKTKED